MGQGPYGYQMLDKCMGHKAIIKTKTKICTNLCREGVSRTRCKPSLKVSKQYGLKITKAIGDIRTQLSKLTTTMGGLQHEKGQCPAQPQANPQGHHSVDASMPSYTHLEHLKSITTLRSGK